MAEGAEAGIRNEVECEEPGEEESKKERDANDKQDSLSESVPLSKGDVGHKYDGSWETEQQAT